MSGWMGRNVIYLLRTVFSPRTLILMTHDLMKLRARGRCFGKVGLIPPLSKLHLGCGKRRVTEWLNVDWQGSDFDLDLSCGHLPFGDKTFDTVVSQHFIEHLEIRTELIPLIRELYRVIKPQGEIWLSCPDIEKICRSYIEHGMRDLLDDRRSRWPMYSTGNLPSSHLINDLFHQGGAHKNLFDFTMLECVLQEAGFTNVNLVVEADLLKRFPEFPPRNDDPVTIYVTAERPDTQVKNNSKDS